MANKILITGGSGFLGTNLTKELRKRGHEVWTCDLKHSDDEQSIRCDVREYRQLERIFDKEFFEYVYHMAAEYGRWNGEGFYEQLWQTNVIGNKNLIRLQEQLKFRTIFFSSSEVYGDYNGKFSEDVMDNVPLKQMNDYAMTKWVGEMQCLNSAEMFKTQTVRVRPTNAYGPGESFSPYRGVIPVFIHKALQDKPYIVYNGHKRTFDYVTDTCNTLANIVDNFIPGEVYNIGSHEDWEVDIKYLSDLILKCLGKDDSKVIYKEEEPFTTVTKHMDFSKARRDLKHSPKVGIEEGIELTVEWIKKCLK